MDMLDTAQRTVACTLSLVHAMLMLFMSDSVLDDGGTGRSGVRKQLSGF